MTRKVLVIDAHPDPDPARFGHALAQAYEDGAREAGCETRRIVLADLEFPLLRTYAEFMREPDSSSILSARADMLWADHIAFTFPLWIGSAPAYLRAFLEQIARGEFLAGVGPHGLSQKLKGKSARLIVTMGMPAFFYRLYFGAFGVRGLKRSALGFAGAAPVRITLFGMIEGVGEKVNAKRLAKTRALGRKLGR